MKYGRVLQDISFTGLVKALKEKTPLPERGFIYQASCMELEELSVFRELQNLVFGGMPMQLGYCNGRNDTLNCLEYHTCSEVCVAADAVILLLGQRADIQDEGYTYDTSLVEAFLIPAGVGIELYATTLHYAPCSSCKGQGYHVANGLLRGTNGACPEMEKSGSANMLCGCNKWLLAHPDAPEATEGVHVGLTGENFILSY